MSSVLLVVFVSLLPSSALAGPVVTANVGVAIPSLEFAGIELDGDSGYSFGGSVGLRLGDMVQWDTVELSYSSADQSGPPLSVSPFTANSFFIGTGVRLGMFGQDSALHPYASFGIGGNRTDFEQFGFELFNEWGFEWNAGAGILFDITDQMSVGARYRYRSSSYDEINGVSIPETDVNIHSISFEIAFGG